MSINTVSWFEIAVTDMDRAQAFYEKVFDVNITVQDFGGVEMGFFPDNRDAYGATGSLMKYESYIPSEKGSLVYFACTDVQTELDRVVAAGGSIQKVKTQISPEQGFMGVIIHSEGNRIALHSKS